MGELWPRCPYEVTRTQIHGGTTPCGRGQETAVCKPRREAAAGQPCRRCDLGLPACRPWRQKRLWFKLPGPWCLVTGAHAHQHTPWTVYSEPKRMHAHHRKRRGSKVNFKKLPVYLTRSWRLDLLPNILLCTCTDTRKITLCVDCTVTCMIFHQVFIHKHFLHSMLKKLSILGFFHYE